VPSKRPALKARLRHGTIYRVGYAPHPWAWVPWQYGPFTGRWDDPYPNGYRVIYAGTTPFACYVEVLANFRSDPDVANEMARLTPDPRDELFDTAPGGTVPRSWFGPRRLAQAELEGTYVDVQHAESIAALRPMFITVALSLGLADFDGAAIRNSEPRDLTQQMSRFLWEATGHDGVRFESRFGNGLRLYAIFERPSTSSEARARSTLLSGTTHKAVPSTSADFVRALALHRLTIDESR
jgi:RES domain